MKKQKLIEFMIKNNFDVRESELFSPENSEFIFMYNAEENKGLVIKEYTLSGGLLSFGEIDIDVRVVKSRLHEKNYNVWNIYYLVLVDSNLPINRKNYSIERSYKNLRKYVISSREDLKRIPFLESVFKQTEGTFIVSDLHTLIINSEMDESDFVIKEILINDGEYSEISKKKVDDIIKLTCTRGV